MSLPKTCSDHGKWMELGSLQTEAVTLKSCLRKFKYKAMVSHFKVKTGLQSRASVATYRKDIIEFA